MVKYEKEIKILDIDVDDIKSKLESINATFKGVKNQKLYTYDIPTIYYRYLECIQLLKSEKELVKQSAITKLEILFDEFCDLVDDKKISKICKEFKINNLYELLTKDDLVILLENNKYLNKTISGAMINPNKWVRLRQTNDEIELTLKQVYEKNDDTIQKVKEIEISVNDFEETNLMLQNMGIVRRNYQEKVRHSYAYKDASIEIDEWPMLKPYMEIECDNIETIQEIVKLLDLTDKEIVSLNTEQLYKRKNIDVLAISELKF